MPGKNNRQATRFGAREFQMAFEKGEWSRYLWENRFSWYQLDGESEWDDKATGLSFTMAPPLHGV
jgi:hypothetical protein